MPEQRGHGQAEIGVLEFLLPGASATLESRADVPAPPVEFDGRASGAFGELAAKLANQSLAHGTHRGHRSEAESASFAYAAFSPLACPACGRARRRPLWPRPAVGRLFHDLLRTAHWPSRRPSPGTGWVHGGACGLDLLLPAHDQQGHARTKPRADTGTTASVGPARGRRRSDCGSGAKLSIDSEG